MRFQHRPCTVEFTYAARLQPSEVWIAYQAELERVHGDVDDPPWNLILVGMADSRSFMVDDWRQIDGGEITGTLWYEDDTGEGPVATFLIRPTLPRDAEVSDTWPGPRIPIPIPTLAAIYSGGTYTMPELYAVADDDGFVATLLLSAPDGLYVRYSNLWHPLTTPDLLDDLTIYSVTDDAVESFDHHEREGVLLSAAEYADREDGTPHAPQVNRPGPRPEQAPTGPLVAAGVKAPEVPTLTGPDDVPDAISAALENPDIQWWVERRLGVLGIDADLPWKS